MKYDPNSHFVFSISLIWTIGSYHRRYAAIATAFESYYLSPMSSKPMTKTFIAIGDDIWIVWAFSSILILFLWLFWWYCWFEEGYWVFLLLEFGLVFVISDVGFCVAVVDFVVLCCLWMIKFYFVAYCSELTKRK